jgi:hypothetical protein
MPEKRTIEKARKDACDAAQVSVMTVSCFGGARFSLPSPSRRKKSRIAGETACATEASGFLSAVGQTVPSASPACGRFFHSF